MRRAFLIIAVIVAFALALVHQGNAASMFSAGDTTLAAGATIKLYPCFRPGGGHIHSSQFYTVASNNCIPALSGDIYTLVGDIRLNVYYTPPGLSAANTTVDSSGFTVPGGGSAGIFGCDSVLVTSRSTQSTTVTWRFYR